MVSKKSDDLIDDMTHETLKEPEQEYFSGLIGGDGAFISFVFKNERLDIPCNWGPFEFKTPLIGQKIFVDRFENEAFLNVLGEFFECEIISANFTVSDSQVLLEASIDGQIQEIDIAS